MEIVPFTSDPSQTFDVVLGGVKLSIAARWRDDEGDDGCWTFDLIRDGEELVTAVPILLGQDLLAPYALGLGGLVASDESGAEIDAGPEDLGERVLVAWLSAEELAILAAAGAAL